MSGFDDAKELIHDLSIAGKIPGKAGERAAGNAVGRYAVNKIYSFLFDKETETWRDGQGNIVPPPSERGDSNRVFSRGMMLETASRRPEYKRAEGRWVDKHPQFPLDSSDPAVVEKHLRDVYESNNVPISAEDARAIREVYERAAGGPKLPHYGGKETALARKALEKLRKPAALPPDAGSDLSSTSSFPPVLVDNKERDRPALDERPQRDQPYSGDEIAAPLGDDDDEAVHLRFEGENVEAPVTLHGVTRRNGEYFMNYQGREFAIPDSDPQEYNHHWQKEIVGYTGDDLAFRSARMRGMSRLFYLHGTEFARNQPGIRGLPEPAVASVVKHYTSMFGKPQEVEEAERRARFSGEAPVSAPTPKRPISEIASEIFDSYRAKRPAPAAPNAPDAAARPSSPPPRPPAAEVDMREPLGREDLLEPIEIEVNDAPGASHQPPSYFDIDAPRRFGASAPGMEYQPTQVLLHEDQIEVNRKRRWLSRCLVTSDVSISFFCYSNMHWDPTSYPPQWAEDAFHALYADAMDADLRVMSHARISALWRSSSTKALVLARPHVTSDGIALYSRYAGEHSRIGVTGPDAYGGLFLTYVPPGPGVSQRLGLQISANYLQIRAVLSPAYLVPGPFRRGGTNDFVQPSFPYSSTSVKFSATTAYPSSTQSLLTIHRIMLVLCTNPLIEFGDVVVDGTDIHSPVSLHTRGVLEVLKDVYVSSDKAEVHSVNLQLKGRLFHFTAAPPVTVGSTSKNYDLVRGHHIVALHTASVVAFPFDFFNAAAAPGTDYHSYLAKMSIPPTCTLSSSFSYSDA